MSKNKIIIVISHVLDGRVLYTFNTFIILNILALSK